MKKRTLYLSDEDIAYIDEYKVKNNISSRNKSLSSIIKNHKDNSTNSVQNIYEIIATQVARELKDKLNTIALGISENVVSDISPKLNSVKYASNSSDKNTQVILEMLNGIYYKEEYNLVPGIENHPTKGYLVSKDRVEKKIEELHYRKSNTID